jgi:hypothetical protein
MGIDARRWQTLMIDFRSFGLSAVRQRCTDSAATAALNWNSLSTRSPRKNVDC